MATPEEIENRLSAVERDVSDLRRQTTHVSADAAAARVLSAGADRDVSEVRAELRAHTGALNALRESQLEMGRQIGRVEDRLGGLETKVGGLETNIGSLETKVGGLETNIGSLETHVSSLEQTVTTGFATVGAGMTQILTLLETLSEE